MSDHTLTLTDTQKVRHVNASTSSTYRRGRAHPRLLGPNGAGKRTFVKPWPHGSTSTRAPPLPLDVRTQSPRCATDRAGGQNAAVTTPRRPHNLVMFGRCSDCAPPSAHSLRRTADVRPDQCGGAGPSLDRGCDGARHRREPHSDAAVLSSRTDPCSTARPHEVWETIREIAGGHPSCSHAILDEATSLPRRSRMNHGGWSHRCSRPLKRQVARSRDSPLPLCEPWNARRTTVRSGRRTGHRRCRNAFGDLRGGCRRRGARRHRPCPRPARHRTRRPGAPAADARRGLPHADRQGGRVMSTLRAGWIITQRDLAHWVRQPWAPIRILSRSC